MKKLVASLTFTPEIIIGKIQKNDKDDWGKINIEKIDNNFQVSLENNKIRFLWTPVLTANLESAITELTIKRKEINVSGKHRDEMAKGGGDRGVLFDKTGIVRIGYGLSPSGRK